MFKKQWEQENDSIAVKLVGQFPNYSEVHLQRYESNDKGGI